MFFSKKITASEAIVVIKKAGFVLVRQKGSHKIYKHQSGLRITIPFHSGKILHPKIIKEILITLKRVREV